MHLKLKRNGKLVHYTDFYFVKPTKWAEVNKLFEAKLVVKYIQPSKQVLGFMLLFIAVQHHWGQPSFVE